MQPQHTRRVRTEHIIQLSTPQRTLERNLAAELNAVLAQLLISANYDASQYHSSPEAQPSRVNNSSRDCKLQVENLSPEAL